MKRTILLLLTVFAATAVQAQQKVTLKQCQGDTVAYLKKNFEEGKARFIGQPFSMVIKEWKTQLPLTRVILSSTDPWANDVRLRNKVNGADLYFTPERTINYRNFYHIPYYGVSFVFEPPYNQDIQDVLTLKDQEDEPLGPLFYEQLKDYIIKDVNFFERK